MNKIGKLIFAATVLYLLAFSAVQLHRTSSGYKRKFEVGDKFKSIDKISEVRSDDNSITSLIKRYSNYITSSLRFPDRDLQLSSS